MKTWILALPALTLITLAGCKHQGEVADSAAQEPKIVVEEFDTVELELVPMEEVPVAEAKPTPAARNERAVSRQVEKKVVQSPKPSKSETIYVETEGAQGRVWGHVTMKGDRGTGTIHDWDENTWSVTVTRHGNELFAVDQNSRQYVFRIK